MVARYALPPIEEISKRADSIDLAKLLVTVLLFLPLALGWVAAKLYRCVQLILAAVVIGWRKGLAKPSDTS